MKLNDFSSEICRNFMSEYCKQFVISNRALENFHQIFVGEGLTLEKGAV